MLANIIVILLFIFSGYVSIRLSSKAPIIGVIFICVLSIYHMF